MTKEQESKMNDYYLELKEKGLLTTLSEANVFKLSYMQAFSLQGVVASLPDANKLYKMAETIVSKQVMVLNMPENKQIDWEDLKNDWFDWLNEEIKG